MSTEVKARMTIVKMPGNAAIGEDGLIVAFDFDPLLPDGVALSGLPIVTETGTSDLTIGTPAISGNTVQFSIAGDVASTTYTLRCVAPTDAGYSRSMLGDLESKNE